MFDIVLALKHNLSMDHARFAALVRQALAHLYDQAYLQRLPLAAAVAPDVNPGAAAQMLHRALLEAIGTLRPPPGSPPTVAAWRSYQILFSYYVEGIPRNRVAEQLAISSRQFSREQLKALEAVTELLWARYQRQSPAAQSEPAGALVDAEWARLDASVAHTTTLPAEAIQSVIPTVGLLAARRNVSLSTQLAADLPPVAMERVVLRQVLLHVLTHLVERVSDGFVEVAASLAGHEMQVTIRHQGRPVEAPAEGQEEDRLALAARMLAAQGGRIGQSEDPAAILLFLPAQQPRTVLVVDDSSDVVRLFRRYLAGSRFQAVGASDGQQALRLAQEIRPCAITLDVMMPTRDGWEILQTLKNLPATKDIPVIVCSVLRERGLALSLGASEYLVKPVAQPALLAALARCLPAPIDTGCPG